MVSAKLVLIDIDKTPKTHEELKRVIKKVEIRTIFAN